MVSERREQPTLDSIRQHPLPEWYDGAKLGIFVGASAPAVIRTLDLQVRSLTAVVAQPISFHRGRATTCIARLFGGAGWIQKVWVWAHFGTVRRVPLEDLQTDLPAGGLGGDPVEGVDAPGRSPGNLL
jgi:hypothetical protein